MASNSNIEFYEKIYRHEFHRKAEIDASLNFPTTLLTLLIGGALYLFKTGNFLHYDEKRIWITIGIIVFTATFVGAFLMASAFLMNIYLNSFNKYKYLPFSIKIRERELFLYEYSKDFFIKKEFKRPKKEARKWTEDQFKHDLLGYYIKFSTYNQKVNDKRIERLYESKKYLMLTLVSLALVGILIILKQ